MSKILKIENIKKYYGSKNNITKAIDDISFDKIVFVLIYSIVCHHYIYNYIILKLIILSS